jgi:hypothetical protein
MSCAFPDSRIVRRSARKVFLQAILHRVALEFVKRALRSPTPPRAQP